MAAIHKEKKVDAYIHSSQSSAKEILERLRKLIFKADPDIKEEIKWGIPVYSNKKLIFGMAGFKKHVTFTFFHGALLKDREKLFSYGDENLHNRSIKFTDVKELNEKKLLPYLKEAVKNDKEGKVGVTKLKKEISVPSDLMKALKSEKLADKFNGMSYTCRKEYVQWIESAKKAETRTSSIEKALTMISKGKKVNEK
jgi:uncharacterized protein YdeI (YjbR/CyaY-like superfamily)